MLQANVKIYQLGAIDFALKHLDFMMKEEVTVKKEEYNLVYEYQEVLPEDLQEHIISKVLSNSDFQTEVISRLPLESHEEFFNGLHKDQEAKDALTETIASIRMFKRLS